MLIYFRIKHFKEPWNCPGAPEPCERSFTRNSFRSSGRSFTMETPRLRGRARPQGGGNILYLDCAGGLSGNIILQKSFNFSLEMGTVYCMQVTLQQSCLKNPSYNMTLNLEQLKSRKNMSIQFQTWHVKLQWHSPPPKFLSFFNARKLKIIISKFKHKNYNKQKGS